MKKILYYSFTLLVLIGMTSFTDQTKPHLIVGNWEFLNNEMKIIEINKEEFLLKRFYFSSDEFTSGISILKVNKKDEPKNEMNLDLAFKIFEKEGDLEYPVLVLKNLCDNESRYAFSILALDKKSLKMRFEKKYSSDNLDMTEEILNFHKTAGPTENWESDEDAIKFEIEIEEK